MPKRVRQDPKHARAYSLILILILMLVMLDQHIQHVLVVCWTRL